MARHRNIRTMNIDDEYYEEDTVYGHSVPDDDYCISPATAAQFTFNRERKTDLSSYMGQEEIPEEEGEESDSDHHDSLSDSRDFKRPKLSDQDELRLNSCLEEVRGILGDTFPDNTLITTIIDQGYDTQKALNVLLSQQDAPKPQREPRQNRRARSQASAFAPSPPVVTLKNPVPRVVTVKANDGTAAKAADFSKVITPQNEKKLAKDSENDTNTKLASLSMEPPSDVVDMATPQKDGDGDKSTGAIPKSSKNRQDQAKMMEEYRKRQGSKDLINLVVIGHVDAGKSTLMGHLLYQLGAVNKRTMHKYEQEAKKVGKGSFAYAWVLDETEEERSRGVTMDVAQTCFQTDSKTVTLLDAPGHKDFIPNMITGAAQADVGILVVNATRGEFETGFETGGQTREHALLVRSLGVSQLIVAINKMDTVDWTQKRFDEIVKKMSQFLKQAGFKDSDLSYVPCSGLSGENLTQPVQEPRLSSWYSGPTLLKQIDKFRPPVRPIDRPFRLCVGDIFKGVGSGFTVSGRVESGTIQNGDKVLVMPAGEVGTAKGVFIETETSNYGFAGDHVGITITGVDINKVTVGSILCDPANPIHSATLIRARVVVFNIPLPLTKGYPVVFHYQSLSEPAVIKRLICQLHKTSGEVVKKRPKCLTKNSNAVIELELERPVCLELYKDFKDLGRFMLRSSGQTIAAGLVEEILAS
ncbi:HBS1-like protein isoform X1 [Liolophura sinensis]|uniref:HBS1-like protein isoform X1 n=1 Tax=Liolophura sinensis TaxID=3198878 RepID=UPI00315846F2